MDVIASAPRGRYSRCDSNDWMEDVESALTYNLIDIVAGILILLGTLQGLRRGLSRELSHVIGVTVAVWAGGTFYRPLGEQIYLGTRLEEQASYALAFFGALVGTFLLMLVIRLILKSIMEFTFKGKIEQVGGAVCGLLRAGLVVGAIIFLMTLWPHEYLHRLFAEKSFIGRGLSQVVPTAYEKLVERYPGLPRVDDGHDGLGPIEDDSSGDTSD